MYCKRCGEHVQPGEINTAGLCANCQGSRLRDVQPVIRALESLISDFEAKESRITGLEAVLTTIANMQPSTTPMKAIAFNTAQELARKALGEES